MNRLDLIEFTSGRTGLALQEVDPDGNLVALMDLDGETLSVSNVEFTLVRTLGEMADSDDFWRLVEEVSV